MSYAAGMMCTCKPCIPDTQCNSKMQQCRALKRVGNHAAAHGSMRQTLAMRRKCMQPIRVGKCTCASPASTTTSRRRSSLSCSTHARMSCWLRPLFTSNTGTGASHATLPSPCQPTHNDAVHSVESFTLFKSRCVPCTPGRDASHESPSVPPAGTPWSMPL